ncbi:hypothetical protein TRIP_C20059 [Candidatus Zixiibacteriota bacterium]|nr:hypothetical protein TRIP_C20059 [candidate division Zixibacteria bacterium]
METRDLPNTRQILRRHSLARDPYSEMILTSANSHMLIEDIHTGIIPFSYDEYKSPNGVSLEPASEEVEQMICNALPSHYGRTDDLRGMVCGFVRYAAHVLAAYGKLDCEIVYYFADQERKKCMAFELHHIPHGIVHHVMGIPFYFDTSGEDVKKLSLFKRVRRIDPARLILLDLPSELGSPRRHRRLIGNMARLGQSVIPSFALEEMKQDKVEKVFDFMSYRKSYELWIASITMHLGWTARGTYRERSTEYFRLVRHLKMKRQMALLRIHIMARLNEALLKVGQVMGFNNQIRMEGLPTPEKYDELIVKLSKGELPFAEAWKTE